MYTLYICSSTNLLDPTFVDVAPDGNKVRISGRNLPGENGPQLDNVRLFAVCQERLKRLSYGIAQMMLFDLRKIMDVDGRDSGILVRVQKIAIIVPVNVEAHILMAAWAAQVAQEAKR